MVRRIALVALVLSIINVALILVGFESSYKNDIGEKQRTAGAVLATSTPDLFNPSTVTWRPTAVEIINNGASDVQLGVRWYKDSDRTAREYTPNLPAGTSLDIGGCEVDSVWINHSGTASAGDSLFWTAAR